MDNFDRMYIQRKIATNALGSWFSDMFGDCGDERSERDRAWNEYNDLNRQISNVNNIITSKENGENMQIYNALENNVSESRRKLKDLEVQLEHYKKIRNQWQANPNVAAQAYGLGYGLGLRLTCNDYRNSAYEAKSKSAELRQVLGNRQEYLAAIERKLSPQVIEGPKNDKQIVEAKLNNAQTEINNVKEEVKNYIRTHTAAKKAENIALQQKAEKEKQLQEVEKKQEKEIKKQTNTTNLIILGGIAFFSFVILSKPTPKKVDV